MMTVLGDGPAYRRLYEQIRSGILAGQLAPGTRLPTSRSLALDAGVSRNTVLAAFDQLRAEGYLEGRRGSGTYVSRVLPEQMLSPAHIDTPQSHTRANPSHLSERGRRIVETARMPMPGVNGAQADSTAFQLGLPALEAFPIEAWSRLYSARFRDSARELMRYNDAAGYRPLREAIASYIATARGIQCTAEQVIVVAGSQQAIEFCARILLDPGQDAWLEDPGYLGARAALVSAGAHIVPVPVDSRGLDVGAGIEISPTARIAIVTPSHQFPLGATMPVERRITLIEWAAASGSWIVEDDYDCEFRYRGRPLTALKAIDRHNRVIYVGTFSKTIFPGLRLGYIIAPIELVDGFVASHTGAAFHAHLLDQAVLADFMVSGHFARHLRRMRVLYGDRQRLLIHEARRIQDYLKIDPSPGGLHLVGWLNEALNDEAVAAMAAKSDLHVWPLSRHCIKTTRPPALLLGYAGTKDRDIHSGVDVLGRVLRRYSPRQTS